MLMLSMGDSSVPTRRLSFCSWRALAVSMLSVQRVTLLLLVLIASLPHFRADVLATTLDPALERLQGYLRVRTDHGSAEGPDYVGAESYLNATFASLIPCANLRSFSFVPGKPVLLATIPGSDPSLSSILLNSHTDVVPAEPAHWIGGPPFEASITESKLYARGAQDMKSIGMQYVEALGELCASGWRPLRTVHVSFVPDEEIGGKHGMKLLVNSSIWPTLRVGFALDEGVPNPENKFHVFRGERQTWWLVVNVAGAPGHGASLPAVTAVQKLHGIIGRALQFRERQLKRLEEGSPIGDIVGVNVAFIDAGYRDPKREAGYVTNVIPSAAVAGFDIRVPPGVAVGDMDKEIEGWLSCGQEGLCEGVSYKYTNKVILPLTTDVERKSWFVDAFFEGLKDAGVEKNELDVGIFSAATDIRYIRAAGVPGLGFSPIRNTPNLLHKHDEYISTDGYVAGIQIYKALIRRLADSRDNDEAKEEL